jgi:hypothetical protein
VQYTTFCHSWLGPKRDPGDHWSGLNPQISIIHEWNIHASQKLRIKFDFTNMFMEWEDVSVPMKDSSNSDEQNYHVQEPEHYQIWQIN